MDNESFATKWHSEVVRYDKTSTTLGRLKMGSERLLLLLREYNSPIKFLKEHAQINNSKYWLRN